jgi:hypothetical protein
VDVLDFVGQLFRWIGRGFLALLDWDIIDLFGGRDKRPAPEGKPPTKRALRRARREFAKRAKREAGKKPFAEYPVAWEPCPRYGHLWVDHYLSEDAQGPTTCVGCINDEVDADCPPRPLPG